MPFLRFSVLTLLVILVSTVAAALPMSDTRAYMEGAAWNRPSGTPWNCGTATSTGDAQCSVSTTGMLTENPSAGGSWYGNLNSASGSAHAWTDNAGLHTKAQLDLVGYPIDVISPSTHYSSSFVFDGFARATYLDTLTVVGSGPVDITFHFHASGSLYSFGPGAAWTNITLLGSTTQLKQPSAGSGGQYFSQDVSTTLHDVQPGQQFSYMVELESRIEISDSVKNNTPKLVTASALSDFGSTLAFGNISFSDGNGTPLDGYSLTSQSGFNYNQFVTSAVPEPSTLAGAAAAFALLAARRPRRKG